jgi:hypothetical protein
MCGVERDAALLADERNVLIIRGITLDPRNNCFSSAGVDERSSIRQMPAIPRDPYYPNIQPRADREGRGGR